MSRCLYQDCDDHAQARYYLAPGSDTDHPWPVSIPYLNEPLPLCDWHGVLVGDQRVQPVR